jgi:hypothetical protein
VPELWGDVTTDFYPYPASRVMPVIEPGALLYILSAAEFESPGDRLELTAFTHRGYHRIVALVEGEDRIEVEYTQRPGTFQRSVAGAIDVLRISLRGADTQSETPDLQLFGLEGEVEVFLEPRSRIPVEVRGRISILGEVRVRLRQVALSDDPPTR